MRNLAIKLVLWLCRVFDIAVLEETRLKMEVDAKARSARWEVFYREEGGLADMLDAIRREAFEAAAELDPSDTDKIYYWATADRNVRKLEQRIRSVIAKGRIQAANDERREAMTRGNPRKSVI